MRILLIAYYFPPVMGGGTMRAVKFAEYLPRRGHDVMVLTHTYGASISDDSVLRVHDPSFNRQRSGLKTIAWLLRRISVEMLNRCGIYHSIYSAWLGRARHEFLPEITAFAPELVIASYSPVETLQLGFDFSERFGIPLISDFRDGLLYEPIEQKRMTTYACVRRQYHEIEQQAAQKSAAITCALPRVCDYFEDTYSCGTARSLPNAFDATDFESLPKISLAEQTFNIVHTGGFAKSDVTCDISPFVSALAHLVDEDPVFASRVRFHQIGRLDHHERALFANLINRGIVIDHGEVSRDKCLAFQKEADLLLLVTSLSRTSVTPAKIFEYLGAGTAILGLTDGTFAAEILKDTGAGWVVHPAQKTSIENALLSILRGEWSTRPNSQAIASYSITSQMDVLEDVLSSLS